ncbi:alpha/beta fold hydrolase [Parasphingorhabdus cellanae]|uniref:Alpha/beta hydrolase n=1 Tax=Parasphingorhabdus cellanae TaxID=2806553 RepID=A0ABX7T5E4_9SPHN|nr:alpha/beta hydrolase [Parasphingorhabdus cellanae]QTD56813.1 alpha/beta hydrolase [Parasphingorhabdus cellanae]
MNAAGQPTEKRFQQGETDLCYFEWGNPADPTILMVHATGFHARCWDKTIAALPPGYRIIAVDQCGHGRSAKPDSLGDWRLMAREVGRLVEGLNLNQMIGVGHSMGAHVLVQIADVMPDRLERLVLVDPTITEPDAYQNPPPPADIDPNQNPVSRRRNDWVSPEAMFDAFKDRHPFSLWQTDVLIDYCQYGLLPADDGEGFVLACPPYLEASVYEGFRSVDPYPLVKRNKLPVAILRAQTASDDVTAARDFANSPTWPNLVGIFPNARELYIPELSHFMPMQDPERIAGYIINGIDPHI